MLSRRQLPLLAMFLSVTCLLPQNETDSLLALYDALNGPYWVTSTNWNTTSDPCSSTSPWYGVTCDGLGETVIQIILDYNNLTGTLPDLQLPGLSLL